MPKSRSLKERFGDTSQAEQRRARLSSHKVTPKEASTNSRESGRAGLTRLPAEVPKDAKIFVKRKK